MSEMPATHHAADRQTQLCSETDHHEDDEGNQSCGTNRPPAGRLDGKPAGPTGGSVTPTPPTAAEFTIKSNQIKKSQICSHKNKTGSPTVVKSCVKVEMKLITGEKTYCNHLDQNFLPESNFIRSTFSEANMQRNKVTCCHVFWFFQRLLRRPDPAPAVMSFLVVGGLLSNLQNLRAENPPSRETV